MNSIKTVDDRLFLLSGEHSSYALRVDTNGRLRHLYFGERIEKEETLRSLAAYKPLNAVGTALTEDGDYPSRELSEAFFPGRDEKRRPSIILTLADGDSLAMASDFTFASYEKGPVRPLTILPFPKGEAEELVITLKEKVLPIRLLLHYIVYPEFDIYARYVEVINDGAEALRIQRAASFALSFNHQKPLILSTFHGGWADELHEERRALPLGGTFIRSDFGSSSNDSAPYFLLGEEGTAEDHGRACAFSLLYSGSHEFSFERDIRGRISISGGIESGLFSKIVENEQHEGEPFVTPVCLMSFSGIGYMGLTASFSEFTKKRLLPSHHADRPRPVLYNNWEATSFSFNEGKIHSLMKKAQKLGIELFVLDDGWFIGRKDDKGGLGDWEVDKKKLPRGLEGLASYAKKLGLSFGIWMEPEMVSPGSDLHKAHPDWVMTDGLHAPLLGRNQLILDLTKKEARDYIVSSVSKILSIPGVSYIKWDYNRPFGGRPSDRPSFDYDYMLGLYEVLGTLRKAFPKTIFESCASGGNRFDHGILCYFDQSWLSDCTDPYERLRIQRSASYLFPPVVFGNHVSAKTNNQTLRRTSLETKFDVASFGNLGYELDLNDLSPLEETIIERQISFYKKHREIFQHGHFLRLSEYGSLPEDVESFEMWTLKEAVIGRFTGVSPLSRGVESLKGRGFIPENIYKASSRPESVSFLSFGHLVNTISPIHLAEEGLLVTTLSRHKSLYEKEWSFIGEGSLLNGKGFPLPSAWTGTGYDEGTRLATDFTGALYLIEKNR